MIMQSFEDQHVLRQRIYGLRPDQPIGDHVKRCRKKIWEILSTHPTYVDAGIDAVISYTNIFPRTFDVPTGNYDPTMLGCMWWEQSALMEKAEDGAGRICQDTWESVASTLLEFDNRTYFLDSTCCEMVQRSKFNESVDMSETLFTIPAFVVSLPKGLDVIGNSESPIISIGVSRTFTVCHNRTSKFFESVSDYELERYGITPEDLIDLNKRIVESGDGRWKDIRDNWLGEFNLPKSVTLAPVLNICGVTLRGETLPIRFPLLDMPARECLDMLFDHGTKEFGTDSTSEALLLTEFTIKLLLFMAAKPEEVDVKTKLIKPARIRRKKLVNESKWAPCFIGRKYGALMKSKGYGERGKVRAHWRQGHFRGVWTGKGKTKHVVKWIDPCYVNDPTKA